MNISFDHELSKGDSKMTTMKTSTVLVVLFVFACKGENLQCPKCFSKVSDEDCLARATVKPCKADETVCLSMAVHSTTTGSRYIWKCSTQKKYQIIEKHCRKPSFSTPSGEVWCEVGVVAAPDVVTK
ncbi:uncharacterized protein [Montipora foliosa]|uniref:uncharacterized protein n=1 Tax=Montipora foliosa TaxID=591990 RepID=UPI0035F1B576